MTNRKKILIADDDVQFVDSMKTLLESVGYQVFFVYSSKDVLENVKKINPDLILLDVMFPKLNDPDGIRISRLLHQDPTVKDVPIIIITGIRKVMNIPLKLFLDEKWMPVRTFVDKPFKPDELLFKIKEVLES